MDDAQAWCQDIEELCNKVEVNSTNTSKSSWSLRSWCTWDGEKVSRKPTDYTVSTYPTSLKLILLIYVSDD